LQWSVGWLAVETSATNPQLAKMLMGAPPAETRVSLGDEFNRVLGFVRRAAGNYARSHWADDEAEYLQVRNRHL
jgi:hypothetical protein